MVSKIPQNPPKSKILMVRKISDFPQPQKIPSKFYEFRGMRKIFIFRGCEMKFRKHQKPQVFEGYEFFGNYETKFRKLETIVSRVRKMLTFF
jgi:hypothetical protein